MYPKGKYIVRECEPSEVDKKVNKQFVWTVDGSHLNYLNGAVKEIDRVYSYDEAMEIAGAGPYTYGLLATLSLAIVSMSIDMFSFSTVVALSTCDFFLTRSQTNILLSMPFVGPIIMAYAWGYISDTQGRRKSLIVGMSVSFLMSVLCAFAPNWITLAVCKFVGTCFCSCAQSSAYALLGESCTERMKGTYLLVMTSVMHLSMVGYFSVSYFIGFVEFVYDLGFITFVPWRLLVLILALPLGTSAFGLLFFYESPKFLLNAGKYEQALNILAKICWRNRGIEYPVKKVDLKEVGNLSKKEDRSFLASLWQQTVPLFKPPLLTNTVLLYCLIFIVYSSSSCLFVWLPFLANDFTKAVNSVDEENYGICSIIAKSEEDGSADRMKCTARIQLPIVIFAVSVGFTFMVLNFFMSRLASKKKSLMIVIFLVSSLSCLGALYIPNNLANIIAFFGIVSDSLCMGLMFTYCVDLYPTSFRGMAACLGVMVARISSIFGVNLIGPYIPWHCSRAFYALGGLIFSGAVLSCFLPSDTPKKFRSLQL